MPELFILEDDLVFQEMLTSFLKQQINELVIHSATTLEEAHSHLLNSSPDICLIDIHLPDGSGLDFLLEFKKQYPTKVAIIMTAFPLPQYEEDSQQKGAFQFIKKYSPLNEFAHALQKALELLDQKKDGNSSPVSSLSFFEWIQLKCMSGSSGVLKITGPHQESGEIHFNQGPITSVHYHNQEGINAFYEIVKASSIQIEDTPQAPSRTINIDVHWQQLLMEAARIYDEHHTS